MKAGRGKGKRGGAGNAGLHKHKWSWTLKYDRNHFGHKGFTSHIQRAPDIPISLRELSTEYPHLVSMGYVTKVGESQKIDLTKAGYTKLLGTGEFKTPSTIIVKKATEKSINKLNALGITVETDEQGNTTE
ncbi:MAG: uL15m family ribosomal protein [Thermoplasmataceae archaeon]